MRIDPGVNGSLAPDATTFAPGMRLLKRTPRTDVYRLYRVLRTVDDLVDEDRPQAAQRVDALEQWASDQRDTSPETHVLSQLARHYPLPASALVDFCQAMRHDIARDTIDTEDDLELYCERAGGAVGIMVSSLLGISEPEDLTRMATLGRAVQRTNILRDIDEDLVFRRVYIARTTIDRFGHPRPGARAELLRNQIAVADELYEKAAIRPRSRPQRAIALSAALYREILRQIEREGYGREPGRVTVPAWRNKLLIAEHRLRLHLTSAAI
ncbi:MAG TPA: squalene/phytoene synthase family protein [Solirubrobacteraceae bacterium]|jgi:phytoene synthase|nr:squalene/phytoene synthase family protein [Solirubrobacteraceae bacterium]